jgi:hypothetical protein
MAFAAFRRRLLIYLRAKKDVFGSTEPLSKPFMAPRRFAVSAKKSLGHTTGTARVCSPANIEAGTASLNATSSQSRKTLPDRLRRQPIGLGRGFMLKS